MPLSGYQKISASAQWWYILTSQRGNMVIWAIYKIILQRVEVRVKVEKNGGSGKSIRVGLGILVHPHKCLSIFLERLMHWMLTETIQPYLFYNIRPTWSIIDFTTKNYLTCLRKFDMSNSIRNNIQCVEHTKKIVLLRLCTFSKSSYKTL